MKRRIYKVIIKLIIAVVVLGVILIGGILAYRRIEQRHVQSQINQIIDSGGISEIREIELGGVTQYIAIEGMSQSKPLCLYLHGGPGLSVPYGISARGQNQDLLTHCTAVYWDQRGSGKSYDETLTSQNVSLTQLQQDAKELINYLLETFNKDKLYVIGFSWGTVLGMNLVKEIPQLIEAYFGIGQVVNPSKSDLELYEWLIDEYASIGVNELVLALKQMGYPPYQKVAHQELFTKAITNSGAYIKMHDGVAGLNISKWIAQAFSSPDLSIKEAYETLFKTSHKVLTQSNLWAELNAVQFDEDMTNLKIPIYFISGVDDYICSKDLLQQWFQKLQAPKKDYLILSHSAHYISTQDEPSMNDFIKQIINEVYPTKEIKDEAGLNEVN
ncbi:alpha/beta hydrolase [Turicibacter sanguinis]|uniref:alpha/beta hydrolase n=1 Tax=Turicibacter sanguinis TaxID=154288 RepID=UPI003996217E